MPRIVLLGPTSLVGRELVELLGDRPDLGGDLRLLSLDDEEIGQLTEATGAAALVARADADAVAGADAIVVCGDLALYRELLDGRPPGCTAILLTPDAGEDDGTPVVSGVNPGDAVPGAALVSPHPGAVLLAELLQGLLDAGPRRVVANLVQPASVFDRRGLDELFAQAGKMVSMQTQSPSALFGGRQLAFNLYPAARPPRGLARQVRAVLGSGAQDLPLAVHVLQGPVFHGFSALLYVELENPPGTEELRARLGEHPHVELFAAPEGGGDQPGPIDVPASDKVLVGAVEADEGGGFWIWAVMDNLTRGGALNALEILELISEQ